MLYPYVILTCYIRKLYQYVSSTGYIHRLYPHVISTLSCYIYVLNSRVMLTCDIHMFYPHILSCYINMLYPHVHKKEKRVDIIFFYLLYLVFMYNIFYSTKFFFTFDLWIYIYLITPLVSKTLASRRARSCLFSTAAASLLVVDDKM